MRRVHPVISVLFLGVMLLDGRPAAADCSGPTIEYGPLEVARGAVVTVAGSAFGSNCYDTGPPPAGEGVLGKPLTDIQIRITQDTGSWLVGRGAADSDYAFDAEVVVPEDLHPGEAAVTVRIGERFVLDLTNHPLTITDEAPAKHGATGVASFGPSSAPPTTPAPADSSIESTASAEPAGDGRDGTGWLVVGIGVGAIGLVALAWKRWRQPHGGSLRGPG